jgi:two-component system sensor histidine kinase GlrK
MRHALAALDSLKEGFVASISHELRTPLAKIREALALLDDGAAGPLAPAQGDLVAIARRACEAQISLVGNLLDLSRLRAGSVVRMHTEGAVEDVVRDAIGAEDEDARRRRITLELRADGTRAPRSMDATLLERAIANLVRNAVQASPEGATVRVLCSLERDVPEDIAPRATSDARWVRVRVEDEGPGVSDEIRERLFEPFSTAPTDASRPRVGVGLGLALAREVARAHGGDARCVATPEGERGARFELWIPVGSGA